MQVFRRFLMLFYVVATTNLLATSSTKLENAEKQEEIHLILEDYEKQLAKDPDNLALIEALADSYYSIRDYRRASELLERAVALDPTNHKVKATLGLSYLFLKDLDRSYPLLEEALVTEPNNPDILFGLGQIAYAHHHFREANDFFQKALARDPKHLATLSSLGDMRMQQKQYAEAEQIFKKIQTLSPQSEWVNTALEKAKNGPALEEIKTLEKEGNLEEAVNRYQQLITSNPNFLDVYLLLGKLYTQMKLYKNALDLYQAGLEYFPASNPLLVAIGFTYLKQKNLSQSERFLQDALTQDPLDAEAIAGLGRLAELKKDYKQALIEYQKALEIDPKNMTALSSLAELRLKQGYYKAAQKLFKQLLELDPQAEWVNFALEKANYGPLLDEIQFREKHKEYKAEENLYLTILSNNPLNPDFYLGLGQFYMHRKRYRDAIEVYLQGLDIQPKATSLQTGLGYAYLFNDDLSNSKRVFTNVLEKHPKNVDALVGLGRIAELNSQLKEADDFYQKALDLDPDNITGLSYIGNLRMTQKRYKEAQKIFKHIVKLDPKALWAKQAVEEAQLGPLIEEIKRAEKEKDFDYLENLYNQLISEAPHYTDYYLRLGKIYEHTHRYPEAIEIYYQGLGIDPKAEPLLVALGFVYLSQKDLEHSYRMFQAALEQEPEDAEALAGLGRVAELDKKEDQAEHLYQQALDNDPNNITALSFMGSLKIKQRQYASAENYYKRLKQLLPKEIWVQQALQEAKFGPLLEEIRRIQDVEGLSRHEKLQRQLTTEKLYQQLISNIPFNADYYLGLGQLYAQMKRFSEAIQTYQHGLRIDPKSSALHTAMGFSYLFKEDLDKSANEFHVALELDPHQADAWAGLGRIAELTGKLAEAETYYQNALDNDVNNITALSFMGALKMKQRQYAEARAIYTKLQTLNPKTEWIKQAIEDVEVAPLLQEITKLEENKEFDKAASLYFTVLSKVSNKEDYYLGLGNLYVRIKEYPKAIEIFQKGLEANPSSIPLHSALGITYLFNKNLDDARREFEIVYAKVPNHAEVLAGLGRIEALHDHLEQAESLYQQSLAISPFNVSTLSFYGDLLMKEKRFDEAYRLYLTLQKMDPKASWVSRALKNAENGPILEWARTLEDLGEWRLARDQYLNLIGSFPDNADYYALLAQNYINSDKLDEGIEILQRGVEIDPEAIYIWRQLAFAYLSREDLCSAYEILVWLIDKDPNDAEAWAGLGRYEYLRSNPCAAERNYRYALEIDPKNIAALSNLAVLENDQFRYFSALDLYSTMLRIQPKARWVRQGFYDTWIFTRPHLFLEGKYHEEDQWDKDLKKWVARYQVYGWNYLVNFPQTDFLSTHTRIGNDYYVLRDLVQHTTLFAFSVVRFYEGARLFLNPCWFLEARIGASFYKGFRKSTFREKTGFFVEPILLFNYHQPKERAVVGFSSDVDLVARDFVTRRSKMVGRWFVIGRYEKDIIRKGILGLEGIAYWYDDFVNNRSQRFRTWMQWNPPKFHDHVSLKYQFQYQRFDKVIPDYYTFKYQFVHYLQLELSYNWCRTVFANIGYGHGWQSTRTRFAQIIVINPILTPTPTSFFTDRRQFNLVYLNTTYKEDPLEVALRADYYRDTTKYTIWSVLLTLGWRL